MSTLLRSNILKRVALTDDELDRCVEFFSPKKIRKHQYLLQEGEVARHFAFVTNGCLRAYTIGTRGEEHIVQFAIADWWISDMHSFLTGAPATYNIDALHDTDALLLEKTARDRLFGVVPKMERFFRLLQEGHFNAMHRRISDTLSASAEERYLRFVETYPALVEMVPLRQIASYLGITPQSLSRIRKELASRKDK